MNYKMPDVIVQNLGKKYKQYPNHWARLAEWVSAGKYGGHEDRWALKDISFSLESGESLGMIGLNGAGKSTLLKILTGTTMPTEGTIQTTGRIAAILELGMGFHPDFSGRENALLACRMAGLPGNAINDYLPAIQQFSELGDYFEQPLRIYSTGMQMRLAFSVATVVRPDILIVDEALSVGDTYFQHKCIQQIRSFQADGTTLLFVSHDAGAIKSVCRRALLLDQGRLIQDGAPDAVLDYYNAIIAKNSLDQEIKQVETDLHRISTRSGSGLVRVAQVNMYDDNSRPVRAFRVGECAQIHVKAVFNTALDNPTFGILIRDRMSNDVFGTNTYHQKIGASSYTAGEHITVVYKLQLNLGYGNYSVSTAIHAGGTHLQDNWDWWDQCLAFEVIPGDSSYFAGVAALPVEIEILRESKL